MPASRPQLAYLDIPKWPPLFALIATACSGGLGSAGWQGNRLRSCDRQLCLRPQLPYTALGNRRSWLRLGDGCELRGDNLARPTRLALRGGQGGLCRAQQQLGLRWGHRHLPRPPTGPLGHRRRLRQGGWHRDGNRRLSHLLRPGSGPLPLGGPQHDGTVDQLGLEPIAALELKGTAKASWQDEPAIIVKFEGRHGCFPKKTEGTSERGEGPDA